MAKAPGVFALIFGIISMTPIPIFSAVLLTDVNTNFGMLSWIIPVIAIIMGIIGVAAAREDKKVPGILGIVFGVVGWILNSTVYFMFLFLLAIFGWTP